MPSENVSFKNNLARQLYRAGISANFLTLFGLFLAGCAGLFTAKGWLVYAGIALIISGLVDLMDGAVARVSGTKSEFGGILDSSLDRYGDGFIFSGLFFYFVFLGRLDFAAMSVSAWMGSFLISYVRARAECEIDSCRVGFWERGERIGVVAAALIFKNPEMAVLILGIGTHWSFLQRLFLSHFYLNKATASGSVPPFYLTSRGRSDAVYLFKIGALVGLILLARIP